MQRPWQVQVWGSQREPLKGEGLSGLRKASPAPAPQSHLPFHLGHHPVSPSPGTFSHMTLCFCPCPDWAAPGAGSWAPGALPKQSPRTQEWRQVLVLFKDLILGKSGAWKSWLSALRA